MKINLPFTFSNLSDMPTLLRYLSPFCQQLQSAINGKLNFSDNIRVSIVPVNFPSTTNQNVQIVHGLPVVPTGYFVARLSAAAAIYDGNDSVFGSTFANLKCNTAGITATVVFF